MNDDERMVELMTEIRDLVRDQRDDYRQFMEKAERAQAEMAAGAKKRVAVIVVGAIALYLLFLFLSSLFS